MKQYMSEGRIAYENQNHGLFSKRLAEWAINLMEVKDSTTGMMMPLNSRSLQDVQDVLKENKIELPEEFIYTAWYLFNMTLADYRKSLPNDKQRCAYVEETLCDPDCCPEAVLAYFETKMCLMETPIFWERML